MQYSQLEAVLEKPSNWFRSSDT